CAQFEFQEWRHKQGVAASHRKSDPQKGGAAAGDPPRRKSTVPPAESFQQRGATAKRKAKPRVHNHSTVERNVLFVSSPAPENIAVCAREKIYTGTKIMTADDIARRKAQNLAKMRLRDGGDCPIGSTGVSHDMKAFIKHSMSSHVGDVSDCAAYGLPSKHLKGSEPGMSRPHATYQSSDILSALPTQHCYNKATADKRGHLIGLTKDDFYGSHEGKLRKFGKFKKKDGEKDLRIEQRKCWMGDVGGKIDQPYPQGIGGRREDAWTQPRKKVRNPCEKVPALLYSTGGKKCMGEVGDVKKSSADQELLFALPTKAKLEQAKTVASTPYQQLEKKEFSTSARHKKNTISQKEASEEEFIRKLSDRLSLYSLSPKDLPVKDLPTKDLCHEENDHDGRLKRSKQHQRSSQKSHAASTQGQDNEMFISGINRSSKLKLADHATSRTMKGLNPMSPDGLMTRSLDGVIQVGTIRSPGGISARSLGEANAWSMDGSTTFSELTVNVSSSHDFLDDSDSTPVASPKQSSSHTNLRPSTHQKVLPFPHKKVNAKSVTERTMKLNFQKYPNDEKRYVSERLDDLPVKSKYEHSPVGHVYPADKKNSNIVARGFNDLLPGSCPPSRSPEPLTGQSHQIYSACDLFTKDFTSEHIHSPFYYSQCDAKVQDGQWPQDKVRGSYSYSEEHPFFSNIHRTHSENGNPVPQRSHSENGGPVRHTTNDKVYSRKMFEENLLPLVSYDAGSDTFKSVEHSVSANVLHSPKVLFSLEVPEESLRDSRKCIDFGENLESEFFRSKIGDDVNTDVISKYMASLAAMSVSGGNLATGNSDIALESGGNYSSESQSGASADEIPGGVRSGEKTSENSDLIALLTDKGDVGHLDNAVCGGWGETNSTKQSIARRQLNYSLVQERSNLVPISCAKSRESSPSPQADDKSIDALHSSSGGSPNHFDTCSEFPMLSSSFSSSSSSSSSSSGSSVRMASPVSHPVQRRPDCIGHELHESSNEQSSVLPHVGVEDPQTTDFRYCTEQGGALLTQTSNAPAQPFPSASPPVASGPYDDTFGEPSHGGLKGTASLSSVGETHMGGSKPPAPTQDSALIPELATTGEEVFYPSSSHVKPQGVIKLFPLKQCPTDDSTENPPFMKAASTDQALQLKPFNLSDSSLPTLGSGSTMNPTKQESLQLSSLSNHCDNDDLINRTLTELNTCNTTFEKHDSLNSQDSPNTHYKLNKHGTLSPDLYAPKVPHFAVPVKHSGYQTALQNINEFNGNPVECRMEQSNLNRNNSSGYADTCLSAYTRDVDTCLAIYVRDSDTCLVAYSQFHDDCLGVGTQDSDTKEKMVSQLKAIIPTNPSADSVIPTHRESQTRSLFMDTENDVLSTTTDKSSEEALDPSLPVAGSNYLNDINSSKGALVAPNEITLVSSQCESKSFDSSWQEEAVNNAYDHSGSLNMLKDSSNVHEDANAPATVDAYISDDNTHVMFYISESKDTNSTHSPSAQTSVLTPALQMDAVQQCALSSARVSSFSVESDLEITSRNSFGKPKCKTASETASLSNSPPLHGDPPGWSSIPPHRTVSTPSCMDREVKSQEHKPTRPSVINMQYCDTASQIGLRKMAVKSASMIFNSRTGLPTQSSPAPLKRKPGGTFDYDANLLNTRALKSAFSCSKLAMNATDKTNENEEDKRRTLSTSAPASTNCLLGNFEESILNGRIDPVGTVEGFTAEIGASGSFCPKHLHVPVSAFFFALSDDNAPSPYLVRYRNSLSYHLQKHTMDSSWTLFNPNKTVVKMFVVRYDLSDMPASSQTFIRQRTVYCPTDINSTAPSFL
ncbi:unnamed protein product, partial [Lymnaea stagnalis]